MLITDSFIKLHLLRAGMEELQADVKMLEQYRHGFVNAGMESMDNPTGLLIQSGMAAKYPQAFQLGSGIEGIGSLIESLKKGIAGLKKLARGKAKPVIEKQTMAVINEVKKTYADPKWAEAQTGAKGSVSIAPIVKLIGGAKDYDEIVAKINDLVKFNKDAVSASAKETKDYWAKVKPFIAKAKSATEETASAVKADLVKALPERPGKSINRTLPTYKLEGDNDKIFALSKENLTKAGLLILDLFDHGNQMEEVAEDLRINCGLSDIGDYDGIASEDLSDALYDRTHWEMLTFPVSDIAEEAAKNLLSVAKALEAVILASIK
ncbi:hypothetical protein MORTIMER_191 [Erwinia phage vB_EamM_Mortimer]|uniref:Uncharacterized protein n=2 Tax=Agricanvirus TaxID=1984776 RepID=A0A2H5BJW4_9CAUD|nr:hypothetical protein MADMEL_188 [Erwinia phage vB_EamM_MadMel]AUG86940.1 hypothetical protein MORTIMER_191 [Erwinia phage vB_EamM_Mortimer]